MGTVLWNRNREYLYIFLLSLRCFELMVSKPCSTNSHKMYKYSWYMFHRTVPYFLCQDSFSGLFARVKINSVPTPSVLITLIFCLWALMISFTIESPRPVPFRSFPLEESLEDWLWRSRSPYLLQKRRQFRASEKIQS